MEELKSEPLSLRSRCKQFFFRKEIPYGMAATRIAISGLMLLVMGERWQYVRELFSTDGAPSPLAANYGFYSFLPVLSGTWAVAFYSLMLVLMFTLMIGWKTRISAAGVFVLFTYFTLQDSLSTMTKYSAICSHVFFLLSLSACGEVWSVDRYQKMKREQLPTLLQFFTTGPKFEIWPQRLLQLFIGIVYIGAAITKMHTEAYFTGDQLRFWLLSNVNHANPVGEAMSQFPFMLVIMAYVAIIWEVLFVFLVWKRMGRLVMLSLGFVFHVMTTISLGLYVFPFVCFSIYCCFLTEKDVVWYREIFRSFAQRWNLSKSTLRKPGKISLGIARFTTAIGDRGFVVGLSILVCGAVMLERSMDVYGHRSPDGPFQLQVMNRKKAENMLRTDKRIREKDKLLSFDVGEFMIGGLVTDLRKNFKQGTHLYVQANLIPPHDDLYLECNLHHAEGALIEKTASVVTRDQFRYTFCYDITNSLAAGEYQFVLRCNAQEIARKSITVLPGNNIQATELLGN